jgi:hypothetical protein
MLATDPEPGLLGAAIAFGREHLEHALSEPTGGNG